MKKNMRSKTNVLALAGYSILTILCTFPLVLKMNTSMYGNFFNTDLRGGVWGMWWIKYSFLHHLPYALCPFLAAPLGLDLGSMPFFPILFIFAKYAVALTTPEFYFNICLLLSFVMTGYASYCLFKKLTGSSLAGFISGLVFTFSPYHLNKVMEFGYIFLGNWIILYFFMLFTLKDSLNFRNILLCGLTLSLLITFNQYYAFFSIIMTAGLIFYMLLFDRGKSLVSFSGAVVLVLAISILINIQAFSAIFARMNSLKSTGADMAAYGYNRSLDYLFAQSARPLSYLLPASTHPVFGRFTQKMFGSIFYGRGAVEQTLYLGWIPLLLSYIAFRFWRHKRLAPSHVPAFRASKENFYIGFFLFASFFSFIFSLPPYLDLGLFKIFFLSYMMHKIFPMFRAYARFGIMTMLFVSALAGFGLSFLYKHINNKRRSALLSCCITLAILFEFTNVPPLRISDLTKLPKVYAWLSSEKDDFIIAEYPMSMASAGEAQENYDYLFYQTRHNKRMVNGAFPGTRAWNLKQKIQKIDTPDTAGILAGLGVKYVIFHADLYKSGEYKEAVSVLGEVPNVDAIPGFRRIKSFDADLVYEVTASPVKIKE